MLFNHLMVKNYLDEKKILEQSRLVAFMESSKSRNELIVIKKKKSKSEYVSHFFCCMLVQFSPWGETLVQNFLCTQVWESLLAYLN